MNNDTPQPTVKDSSTPQKPACPVPVHLLPKDVLYITQDPFGWLHYYGDSMKYLRQASGFIAVADGNNYSWSREEALKSQLLDRPNKPGVYVIFGKTDHVVDEIKDITTKVVYDEYDGAVLYEKVTGTWSFYSVHGDKFYYMGPLPTAESEVQS